tara:strand:- start:1951 stop:2268 length:318 start_codon:yes stop_codon:yes gene_type:complete
MQPTSKSIETVIDYILHSEMGGEFDSTDPWTATYLSLKELLDKVRDEEDGCRDMCAEYKDRRAELEHYEIREPEDKESIAKLKRECDELDSKIANYHHEKGAKWK